MLRQRIFFLQGIFFRAKNSPAKNYPGEGFSDEELSGEELSGVELFVEECSANQKFYLVTIVETQKKFLNNICNVPTQNLWGFVNFDTHLQFFKKSAKFLARF
jgi:hypothetical protein